MNAPTFRFRLVPPPSALSAARTQSSTVLSESHKQTKPSASVSACRRKNPKTGGERLPPEDTQISRTITRSLSYTCFSCSVQGRCLRQEFYLPFFFFDSGGTNEALRLIRDGEETLLQRSFLFLSSACQSQRSLGLANGAAPLERSADPDDDRYRLPAIVPRGRRSPGTDPSCSDVYGLRCRARTVCDSAPS